MQDPEVYLKEIGVTVPCAVHPERPAVLDAEHRASINYETYFFSDDAARQTFLAEPTRFCGLVTDPVTRERFHPGDSSPRLEHAGRLYFFATAANREQFAGMPDMYALPNYEMLP